MEATPQTPDRNLAMELVRVTEAAAMAASRWMGRGDKNGADGAAVAAMRTVLPSVPMDGIVVIGEGEKDEAPMLYNGERIGDGTPPLTDIAVDPLEGTTPTAQGRGNALAVIGVSERGTMFNPGPCVYMEKLAVGAEAAGVIDPLAPPAANLEAVAKAKGESIRDITAVILDRDRHADLIREVRAAGARVRLIQDGDVAGSDVDGVARHGRRHPVRHRRIARGRARGLCPQVHGRRPLRTSSGPATTTSDAPPSTPATTSTRS